MKACIKVSLLLTIAASFGSWASSEKDWKYPALPSVKTVTLGSPLSLVFKQLGPPSKKTEVPPSEMGMPASQNLQYDGLTIGVYQSETEDEPHVWLMRATGRKLLIYPGITIGMTKQQLIRLLGIPDSDETREDGQWLFWTAPEPVGSFHVRLSEDRVIEFTMLEDWS